MRSLTCLLFLALFGAVLLVEIQGQRTIRVCDIQTNSPQCARLPRKGCHCPKNLGTLGYIREERWFYNKNTRQCESFSWSTNGGNCNNFPSFEECEQTCSRY